MTVKTSAKIGDCNSVIFYLANPEKRIMEFKRVLKKGGIVFITAHTKYSLFILWRCIKRLFDLNPTTKVMV